MRWSGGLKSAVSVLGAALCLVTGAGKAAAQNLAGEYQCTEAHVAGKTVPCKAAPLSLKTDGKFELQGREGEYLVSGNWVELKGAALKSWAKIEAGYKIVFRFYNKHGLCEIIYERRVVELGEDETGLNGLVAGSVSVRNQFGAAANPHSTTSVREKLAKSTIVPVAYFVKTTR